MTDLARILPAFPAAPFAALLAAAEQHALSTADLLALHPADLARQTRLPLLDVARLVAAVRAALAADVAPETPLLPPPPPAAAAVSTLDDGLDAALAGGLPIGCVSEVAGESGAGKTQLLLALCLAVQLPPPRGLARKALYISTEARLATRRLAQMLAANPVLARTASDARGPAPSLDNILSTVTPDLESQDHILEYQVPVLVARHRVGLVVIDSVAANYRAELEPRAAAERASYMAARSAQLVRLGALLRDLARRHGLAVVVANQVADRFPAPAAPPPRPVPPPRSVSAAASSPRPSAPSPEPAPFSAPPDDGLPGPPPPAPALLLDHQQRWFTGWGDDPASHHALKTPSLGLVWSTQIACRIALHKRPVYGRPRSVAVPLDAADAAAAAPPALKSWRRWLKVVFAPHVAASGQGLDGATEFDVTMGGLRAVRQAPDEALDPPSPGRAELSTVSMTT